MDMLELTQHAATPVAANVGATVGATVGVGGTRRRHLTKRARDNGHGATSGRRVAVLAALIALVVVGVAVGDVEALARETLSGLQGRHQASSHLGRLLAESHQALHA